MSTLLLETSTYTTAKSRFNDGLVEIVRTRAAESFPNDAQLRDVFSRIPRGAIDKKVATGALALARWKHDDILSSAIEYVLLATAKDDGNEEPERATALLLKMSNAATLLQGFNQILISKGLSLF